MLIFSDDAGKLDSSGSDGAFWLFHFLSIQECGRKFSEFIRGLEKQEFQGVMPKFTLRKLIFYV